MPRWMAPELVEAMASIDGRVVPTYASDVWAYASVVIEVTITVFAFKKSVNGPPINSMLDQ